MAQILPGATIGILGSGQLGRMLAVAARQMGYRVHVLSPGRNTPTGQVADVEVVADYEDLEAVRAFAQNVAVVTYEFENVPATTAETCAEIAPLRPGANVLHVAQNRLREKRFFAGLGLPTVPFTAVHSLADLEKGLRDIGCPAVLKTAVSGYDGKGQVKIEQPEEAAAAWGEIGAQPAVLEGWVEFEREVSVVAARGVDGGFAHFGVIENSHENHILDVSLAPGRVSRAVADTAVAYAHQVMAALEVVGVLCVEFFVAENGRLLLNEMAPRPHNSGHLTIEACVTSQFEQQLRAVCGLPLGDTRLRQPAAMVNLLGDLWPVNRGEAETLREMPDWNLLLAEPRLKLHLYGKDEARPGRKMGHVTAVADSVEEAEQIVRRARGRLLGD